MGLSTLLGDNLAAPISAVFNGLHQLFPNEIDRVAAQAALEQLEQQPLLQQALIDQIDAASPDWFERDWRSAISWVCCFAFAWAYVIEPMLLFFLSLFHIHPTNLPVLDMATMMPILLGILGLGGFKTFENTNSK